ncbi:TIGR03943 family protein [Agromyces sp. LHK192]|uniref:TIGR03943 family putative permease subunit n=1 Tax=Agromyces sp. LHK192 TaxID=2498704 RepID=UPI001F0C39CD|nr:TIGR03943 family protein [Agromyces sp. LHK192]
MALTLIGVVVTVWLGVSGQLGLYIHPRYNVFTIVMAVIGGVVALAALALVPLAPGDEDEDEDDHDHDHDGEAVPDAPPRARPRAARRSPGARAVLGASAALAVIAISAFLLLAFPPATLSAQTAVDRDIDRTTADLAGDAPDLTGADPSTFTVKDWALLTAQETDPSAYADVPVELIGFVAPAPGEPDDVFYLARFTVTCCAVDAQPIGVPVYLPDWQERVAVDDWVRVSGTFGANPSTGEGLALIPETVEVTEQPEQPYVY